MTSTQPEARFALRSCRSRFAETVPYSRLRERARAHAGLVALLALTGLVDLWGLGRLGYGNEFYAAAVKAGTQSWKAFFFGSIDPANFITVDKPPASLWVMELSGRVFGFSSWSLLAPQAIEGIAAVALLYATVRRWFSTPAALLSGAILALTPVAALMFRFDNPDALLVLLLVLAAYAVVRAIERAGVWWLALAGAAVGLGFLTKMMQAFLVLPALALAYFVAAPASPLRRLWHLALASAALLVTGGWWVAAVELTPASARPYVGGSTDNSILDLIWGYNGLGRISGSGAGNRGGFSGRTGILRLFNTQLGGQISWLIPAALVVFAAGLWATLPRPRTDRTRAALVLWGVWLLAGALTYSYMSGIIHPYYSNTLAPAVAVLVGVGATLLWSARRQLRAALVLATMLIATSAWSYVLLDRTPSWHPWLRDVVLAAGVLAAVALVAVGDRLNRPALAALASVGLLAGLGGPVAYTLNTVATVQDGTTPSAGPASVGGMGGGFGGVRNGVPGGGQDSVSTSLTALLNRSSGSFTWVAATSSSMSAAPIELATGKAVMAIGGFNGGDRAITLAHFKQLVAERKIHYYVGSTGGGGAPGGNANTEIASWVASTFTATTVGGATLYDLTS